jgi:flagellar basal-body rod modification protein FlgD
MSGTVNGTNGAGSTATPRTASPTTGFGADFNTFLTLLTTQLKNQDPTNAMDPNEMTQQLVQFAGVEQQLRTNTNLESLISVQQGAQLVGAAPLMGRVVEVESDRLSLQGGLATLRLPPAGEARRVGIGVLDSQGNLIRAAQVDLNSSTQDWAWDGQGRGRRAAAGRRLQLRAGGRGLGRHGGGGDRHRAGARDRRGAARGRGPPEPRRCHRGLRQAARPARRELTA